MLHLLYKDCIILIVKRNQAVNDLMYAAHFLTESQIRSTETFYHLEIVLLQGAFKMSH